MLTADLVNTRRHGGQLRIVSLDEPARARAAGLAETFLALAGSHIGRSREELEEAWAAVEVDPRDRRLADGIRKLVEDRCELDSESIVDPAGLRRALFLRAATARREGTFNRQTVIDEVAAQNELSPENMEREIYADLRGAHVLRAITPTSPVRLVDAYDLGQAQAVLLRAVRVTVEVECSSPGAYRALFQKLKFLRLLHSIRRRDEGGYRIDIDGPYSLFESVTKYGLQLALALPVIRESDKWRLEADVRWGKGRTPLVFRLEDGNPGRVPKPARDGLRSAKPSSVHAFEGQLASADDASPDAARLPDNVEALVRGIQALDTPWKVSPATTILDLPGVGLCVPDLLLENRETGDNVHLEVLGFWSREAVWRRIDLIERGLGGRILFAVSQHLRVSEEVLGDDLPGALYVYKRVMNARAVIERVEAVARRVS